METRPPYAAEIGGAKPLPSANTGAIIPSSDTVQEVRHTCGKLVIAVKPNGIELMCKCGGRVLYTWRQILTMQLLAWT